MRKAARTKVLRLAVVVDDLVCDELHQSAPGSVTVGSSLRNTLVLFGAHVPDRHRLFEPQAGRYLLHVPPQGAGKISLGGKTTTLSALRRKARLAPGQTLHLKLPWDAKGKLRFGDTTILFQFAAPKPIPRRVPFPVEFKPRLDQLLSRADAASLASAALVLGSYFTWAANAEVDVSFGIEDVDPRLAQVMGIHQAEPEPEPEPEQEMLAQEDEEPEKKEEKKEEPEEKVLKEKPKEFSEKALKKARGVGIARVLGTYSDDAEGAVFDVIQQTENNLGEMFAQGMTTTILADGGDISPFVAGGTGITAHGDTLESDGLAIDDAPELEKPGDKRERKVKGKLTAKSADIFGDVDKRAVQATIRRRISALRYCYERALRTQPNLAGKITYTISISVMGSVTRVTVEDDTVGSAAVQSCTVAKIKGWRFPMDGAEEAAEVTFPVVFSGGT